MDQACVSASCKTITTDPDKGPVQQLFVLVHWHEDIRRFDVSLTDCINSWVAKGCTTRRNDLSVNPDQAWQRTKEALGDGSNGQYIYWTTKQQKDGTQQLQLWWAWELGHFQGREVMALQPPLQQQQDGAAALCIIMSHMMASYSILKAAVAESKKAQQLLERSLAEKEAVLKQKVQAEQEREKVLFTKFAMLLNKKTERIQLLTEKVQEQEQQLEQLKGTEEQDTDDEAKAMAVYAAETDDEEDDEQLLQELPDSMQQQQRQSLAAPVHSDLQRQAQAAHIYGEVGGASAGRGLGADLVDVDGDTQPLDETELAALAQLQQHKPHQQKQEPQQDFQQKQLGANTPAADPAGATSGGQIGGIDWNAVHQVQQQGGAMDIPAAHISKAIKRRR